MSDKKTEFEGKVDEYKKEFDALDIEKKDLIEQGKKINTRLTEIHTRQIWLSGAYIGAGGKPDKVVNAKAG